jgi:hypothetical protein
MIHCNILRVATFAAAALISTMASAQTTVATKQQPPAPSSTALAPKTEGKDFSLELAKAELAKQGIKHPTQKQIEAARRSIQARRSQGEGWGEIAHSLGLNFGKVVSASNHHKHDGKKDGKRFEKGERKESKGGIALAANHSTEGAGSGVSHGEHSDHGAGGGGGSKHSK